MTKLKDLKTELRKLNYEKESLPRLIDCSKVYGDSFYSDFDLVVINKRILEVENQIKIIDGTL